LSSPETYKILAPCHCKAHCKNKVDFPIPGSPATSTTEPGTKPPPKVRLSSPSGKGKRAPSSDCTELMLRASKPESGPSQFSFAESVLPVVLLVFSSSQVFHFPQLTHLPAHFALSNPHS